MSISLIDSIAISPPPLKKQITPAPKELIFENIITTADITAEPLFKIEPIKLKQPLTEEMQEAQETTPSIEKTIASIDAAASAIAVPSQHHALQEASFNADYLHNPKPQYPSLSIRLGEQGKVLLHVHVSTEGKPLEVAVKKSSGYQRLDRAAVDVVQRWQFIPAKQGDMTLESWVDVPVQFALEN